MKRVLYTKFLMMAVAVFAVAFITVQHVRANASTVLFADDFSRTNSGSIGNGWQETESKSTISKIDSEALLLTPADADYEPILTRSFDPQSSGSVELTYDFDWTMTSSENSYEVMVQLGSSNQMADPSSPAGVAVNLKWAGPAYGMDAHEGFGYVDASGNSEQVAVVSGLTTIRATANLDNNTFSLDIDPTDGVIEATNIPFSQNTDIDTLRLYANSVNNRKFSGRTFDNVSVVHTSSDVDEPAPTGPVVFDINASDILDTSTSISWQTDQPATSQVSYGTTDCACDKQTTLNTSLSSIHLHYLSELEPDTTYYYTVSSRNAEGVLTTSSVQTFDTTPAPDTTDPVIESSSISGISSQGATVIATTNEPATIRVSYGTTSCACSLQTSPTTTSQNHQVVLNSLQPATTYYYLLTATDSSGNTSTSAIQSFTTSNQQVVGNILVDDFNRSSSNNVGSGWTEQENKSTHATITDERLQLTASDDAFAPIVSRSFARQTSGTVEWSFDTNWALTGTENNYEVLMQLGDSSSMTAPAQNGLAGTAVNLKWASPSYGMNSHGGFGYTTQTGTTQLITLSGSVSIHVEANLDTNTYNLDINPSDGVVEAVNIPFSGANGIDTIRFYANALNGSKVSGKWIDNIVIKGSSDTTPGPVDTTPPTLSNVNVASVGSRTATVKWNTNEASTAQVLFSTSPCPCSSGSPVHNLPKTSHSVQLGNLAPDTTYYYQVVATDLAGNVAKSQTASFKTTEASNVLTVQDNWVLRDGEPMKLMGVRTASATDTQEQADHLIDQLDEYKAHGINTVTVFYMGSRAANYDPFSSDGTSIDAGHQARMEQIIQAADARDMVVIVGIFYQAAPNRLADGAAFFNAVRTVAASLSQYDNIIINIANEQNSSGYGRLADKADINDPQTIIDMAAAVHDVDPDRIVGGGGYDAAKNIEIGLSPEIDILLFDTGGGSRNSGTLYDNYVAAGVTKPMANVEMFGGYTGKRESRKGVFDNEYKLEYTNELDRAEARAPLGMFFHNGPWMQVDPMWYNLGGYGTVSDPGIRWYFEYVRDHITHP